MGFWGESVGRQVAFYMTAADEEEILRFLRERGDIAVIPYSYASAGFPELPVLPAPESREHWYTLYLVSRSELGKIRYRPVKEGLFTVDPTESPVVEWGRSMQRGTKLKEGRFWIGGTPASRTERAVALYEDLRKWLKKNYTRSERGGIFVGPDAARWAARGGQLIFLQDAW